MAWIPAVAGLAGSVIGDLFSQSGQQATNAANVAQTQQTQQWETTMSDTAMTRRVEDLKAAGLNPMLAVQQGGASTPGMQPLAMQNPGQSFGNLGSQVSSAMQLQTQQSQIDQQKAIADKASADAATTRAQLPYAGAQASQAVQELKARTQDLKNDADLLNKKWDWQVTDNERLMQTNEYQREIYPLQVKAQELDNMRVQYGMPKLAAESWFFNGPLGHTATAATQFGGALGNVFGGAAKAVSTFNKAQYPTLGR